MYTRDQRKDKDRQRQEKKNRKKQGCFFVFTEFGWRFEHVSNGRIGKKGKKRKRVIGEGR